MKIDIIENNLNFDDCVANKIKNRVKERAKFQKVMLLYDASSNPALLHKIQEIKEFCIFNQLNINQDISEIYNGYKVLIIICSTNAFLASKIKTNEFESIFLPTDEFILPYYLDETNYLKSGNDLLIMQKSSMDINICTSVLFNHFYNFLNQLLNDGTSNIEFSFASFDITQKNLLSLLDSVEKNIEFIDVEIIKNYNLDIAQLPILDYVLLSALLTLFQSIKNKNFELVDTYKVARENDELLNKFYLLATNEQFANIVNLNFRKLNTICLFSKNAVLEVIKSHFETENLKLEKIIEYVKDYSKNTNNIFSYLYLYNVFGT